MATTTTVPPKESFRIDMLWNDSRYRSTFIQIVALILVLISILYLINNVRDNLAALGKTFGFEFMTTPASYDINQQPIEYTSRDSHSRAAIVGMLNTLLVAVVGCFLATAIGVIAGVLRLSKNWLIRNLMAVYIEGVRNIPVLIQILLFSALITKSFPQPRDFRGEDPAASMWFWDSVALTNRGVYTPLPQMQDGSVWVILALIAGIIAAVVFGRWATKRQQETGQIIAVLPIKIALILGLPILTFLIVLVAAGPPITLSYPALKGFNFRDGFYIRESYISLTLALSIYTGAFIAESVRAGIQSVSRGQTEAAFALGLQPGRTMSLVILPQALRVIVPPLISQYLNLTKNSSLALLIGYMDVTGTLGGITLNQTGKEFETLFLLMAFYLAVSLSISAVMNLYNENTKLVERTSATGVGFSLLNFFDRWTGDWELLKKGDAKMRPDYGIRGLLNLYVLFYLAMLVLLLNYVFIQPISPERPSYYDWSTVHQIAALAMLITAFGSLVTCLFKSAGFINLLGLELAAFIFALLVGFPFAQVVDSMALTKDIVDSVLGEGADTARVVVVIVVGFAARLAILGYTVFGARPNLTFFNRERRVPA